MTKTSVGSKTENEHPMYEKLLKQAGSEAWEHDVLDKENSKLISMFSEFTDHRKSGNSAAATHMADLLAKRIPDYTAEIVKLFNMDAKEETPNEEKIENTIEKLKMWKTILKTLEEYIKTEKPAPQKDIGPFIRRKTPEVEEVRQEAGVLVRLYKLAHELDARGDFELADEIDEAIKTLAKRVGINNKGAVALANYFDETGEIELADKIDAMLKVK